MFVVEAADLKAITTGSLLCKYADDTYIIIPASNSHTRTIELEHNGVSNGLYSQPPVRKTPPLWLQQLQQNPLP